MSPSMATGNGRNQSKGGGGGYRCIARAVPLDASGIGGAGVWKNSLTDPSQFLMRLVALDQIEDALVELVHRIGKGL